MILKTNSYQRMIALSLVKTFGRGDIASKSFADVMSSSVKDAAETILDLSKRFTLLSWGVLEMRTDKCSFVVHDHDKNSSFEIDFLSLISESDKYKFSHSQINSLRNAMNMMQERKSYV